MNDKPILILGGSGNTGRWMAHYLLQESDARLVLAGRSLAKAQATVDQLNSHFPGGRVSARAVDAADKAALRQAFGGARMVVVASSTVIYMENVATAALEAGIDYFDVQFSTHKVKYLQGLDEVVKRAGLCFITEGGFHPGVPAALVRWAAPRFDRLDRARVGSVIQIDWAALEVADSTASEMVDEFSDFEGWKMVDGEWKQVPWSQIEIVKMDFCAPFGRRSTYGMFLEEMRSLPDLVPGIRSAGFYVGGFNWFVDGIVLPFMPFLMKVGLRKPVEHLLMWGLKSFTRPPYGTLLKLEADGEKAGGAAHLELILAHPDGYVFTAVPAVACLLQILDGSARRPGVHMQALVVEPGRFLKDIERMGIEVREQG